jgi:N-formylglutamate deformylase
MTDSYTDELFGGLEGCQDVVFPVSRLVVDPERFEDDAAEVMADVGMGVIYEVTHDLQPLRKKVSAAKRKELLTRYYRPHHEKFTELVRAPKISRGRAKPGTSLIIDAHSYPSVPLPYEMDDNQRRPQICLGSEEQHTPDSLCDMAISLFTKAGFDVAVNQPFGGAVVPDEFYHRDMRISSLMIEVRRDLYMNEATGEKLDTFDAFRARFRGLLDDLIHLYGSRQERLKLQYHPDNELGQFVRRRWRRKVDELAKERNRENDTT